MKPAERAELLGALAGLGAVMLCCATAFAGELTAEERAGQQIYQEGTSPTGGRITALVGAGALLAGAALPCAGCHGRDGTGRPEGGIEPTALGWSGLTKPYGHVHRGGRRHPGFTERTVARAITEGVDPGGNRLDPAMPRYSLSRQDLASLLAYLKRIEKERAPGVSDTAIRIGAVLPLRGRAGRLGQAARGLLERCFAELNAHGGIHGRRLELTVVEQGGDPGGGLEGLRRLVATEPPLALVAGIAPGNEKELAELAERAEVPLIGPLGLSGTAGETPGRQVFFTLPGLRVEAQVLVDYAATRLGSERAGAAIVHPGGERIDDVARAARAQLELRHRSPVEVLRYERGRFDPALVAPLARAHVPLVVFLGDDAELEALLGRAQALDWRPYLLVVSALAARAALAAPPSFAGRIFLSFPTLPADEKPAALAELARLQGGAQGPAEHSAQVGTYIAAKVLLEGLRRAGRQLGREKLIAGLEGLYAFDTGLGRPLTYGPNRRIGALGSYVVTVDLGRKTFRPVSGWMALTE